ncbi:PREDICTED: protein bassoon isoform X2 [Condylura cristata]|uniref:protein bassoon isoform X2 n=1 Tax=Condylura cristata TaxID=143302 RepID=UPI00033468A3|nr:PREDICTED: protein bassoon isoform X2 [Condylura cristata]
MGNEASLEGGAGDGPLPPGGPGPGLGPGTGKPPSAPVGSGQLPAAGAARVTAGPPGPGAGPGSGPGPGSISRRLDPKEPLGSQRAASPTPKQASATAPGRESPRETRAQGPAGQEADGPRRTLQVDSRTQRSGRSPSVSPDRGSTPTSPYSVPQIAPLPSSTLCPICKTSDLTSTPSQPNFNTCTQCHSKVCNQCGFNPNPHLTQVKEWLCLNCQMQRALGMDMTTAPRSKSQQQLHSPALSPAHSPAKQPLGKLEQEKSRGPGGSPGPRQGETARATSVPGPVQAAGPPEVGRASPQPHHPTKPSTADPRPPAGEPLAKSATTVPPGPGAAEQTQEGLTGKLFGLGASLLTQASTLMSAQPEPEPQGQPASGKGPPKIVFSDASKEASPRPPGSGPGPGPAPGAKTEPGARTGPGSGPGALARTGGTASPKHGRTEHQAVSKAAAKPKTMPKERASCPLCQAELNVGSKGPANYNTCTTCKLQVCNLCGFNPTPHLVEKSEWLCLNCQTKRLLEGSLGEPAPWPLPTTPQQPAAGAPHRAAGPSPQRQKGPQGLGQPSGPLPAKASPPPTKASPQVKPLRASEPSRTPSSAQDKKTGVPVKAEPVPKPPPDTTPPPGTPKAKTGSRKTEPTTPVVKSVPEAPKGGEAEELVGKPYSQDLSRSPQSLSDTGYSSDGVSSSQSEITGVVQQEVEQLDSAGVTGPRPPSPSELHKVGSSMRPSLEGQGPAPSGERSKPSSGSAEDQKQRPHSLSLMPEAFGSDEELEDILEEEEASLQWGRQREQQDTAESSDDFGSQLRHDYVEDSSEGGLSPLPPQPPARSAELTDEEFMRRQILEMSAEEDNLEEDDVAASGHGLAKHGTPKGGPRSQSEPSQEPAALPKRRLPHNATTGYEDLLTEGGPAEATDGSGALQGGLRRFKTIELNSTGSYGHELDLGQGPDPGLDREPELEMESLTGSPEDRSRGEHSSTLPASTPSYTSGTSPTSLSSLEEDSDSSPSRRQRLEEAKQQRKARHRSHGPLLPTIEDSSEEEELREEEELLREQEKMREVEQQRIRSTARKTRRDKEELRAQRRRERSKTPPSNLSPIEDASPTEELRQAAEMEELHRSSCSEYSPSPSLDSEAEAPDGGPSRLYKSGSEYNLPTFMSLYSPTETPLGGASAPSSGRPLKSAEEAYEEMMRKAELLQRQQGQAAGGRGPHGGPSQPLGPRGQGSFEYQDTADRSYGRAAQPAAEGTPAGLGAAVYEEILQTSQSIARMRQASSRDLALAEDKKKEKQFLNAESAYVDPMKQNGGPLTPGTSPTQLAAPMSFSTSVSPDGSGGRVIPDVRVTQHFAKESQDSLRLHSSPASPSSASKEVGTSFPQSPGSPAATTVAPCPPGLPRGYAAPASPAGSERSPAPAAVGHGYGQTPATANYGSQTEELPLASSVRPAREKPPGVSDGDSGTPQPPRAYSYFSGSSPPLSPSSPSESPMFSPGKLGPRATAEFSTQTPSPTPASDMPRSPGAPTLAPMVAQGTQTPHRPSTPRLVWQQTSQEAPIMVITLASDASSQTRMVHASASTSPVCSPTDSHPSSHSYSQTMPPSVAQLPPEQPGPPGFPRAPSAGADGPLALYGWGALPAENISLCRISSVPGTSRVEPGPRPPGSAVVDLRTAVKPTPIILTDQGMDLTSLAVEARKYGLALDPVPGRQSTAVQPLVINLNAQEQTHAFLSTATTVSITMASSVLMAQQKQPVVYGDPFQSRLDFGQGTGSPVCLAQVKQVEQAVQTAPYRGGPRGRPREAKFARYNLPNQVAPLARRDVLITQMGPPQSAGLKSGPMPEPGGEPHRAAPAELRSHALPGARKPHTVVVQMGEGAAGTVTTLLPEEPAGALDLTGMRPESQLACCDMVYKFPFGSSCTGTFHPTPSVPEKSVADVVPPGQSSGPFYSARDPEPPEPPSYRAQGPVGPGPGPHEEQRPYPQGLLGRLYSSMSDTNLAEAGLSYHAHRIGQLFQGPGRDSAVDLSSLKHSYSLGFADGRCLGQGLQYGSFTDLRHPTDLLTHPLPMRRYSSVSNIYSDHRYGSRGEAAGFQEASLAQYSATTAREISRMCAALNSMDQYGGQRGSGGPDLMQYHPQPGPGLSAPQGLAPLRPGLLGNPTFPEGHPSPGNLAQYRPTAGQGTAVRQLLPSTATVRAADGMIYSTINTPIAATLPITTQPASVLRPLVRGGMYRPYASGAVTAVPLTGLTRMPVIAPRVPLGPPGLYRYPAPSRFPAASGGPPAEGPVYLGKPAAAKAPVAGGPPRPELPAGATREEPLSTSAPAAVKEAAAAPAPAPLAGQKPPVDAAPGGGSGAPGRPGLEKEEASQEERQRKQQEQLLQLERERVELEKLRQLRLQEELERERVELQRHREEEQLLVQRELQELQTIKHHVLQQQQEERQAQFALQREQLAQQRLQLEQIQQLQQQLQQQLEEQKQRQKAPFPAAGEAPGRGPPPAATELAQNGQYWPPLTHAAFIAVAGPEGPGQPREPVLHRGLPSSASDMSLQTEEQWDTGRGAIKKRHSMPRLRDICEPESGPEPCMVKRIADSSVQTDDEDGEGRYLLTRRRRARRSADCSVQTDDEDNAEWEQPVRRRRSRLPRHSDPGSDGKADATAASPAAPAAARAVSSVGIQTISDCSVQTEPDQLPRVSPAIHITAATDPKVEIIRYISAPEKTGRGESLACQTEPEGHAQGVAAAQLVGPAAISPYLPGIQIVTPGPLGRFEKKKPDPLEIGYQAAHLPPESLSQLVSRQPPKSPQVLYSPVSPLSPHRLLDTSFASSERLNKAHVSPQKHFAVDSALRQQTLPRPMKTLQRSLSDPKPLSPTAEESAKERFSLYQHQGGLGSQVSALPPNGLVRKVKRTLPSPPPEEAHLPLAGQAPPQLYAASLLQRGLAGPTAVPATKASLLRELDRDLRLVEHESTKLRKKQAELDEEEKEIDAKLKYLELGITQRKESLAKDRGGSRDYPALRGLGEHRDYLSDSELNQLRLQGCATPAGQYADFPVTAAAPATPSGPTAFQQPRFPPSAQPYTAGSGGPAQNGFPAQQAPAYPGPSTYPAPAFPPGASYPAEPSLPSQQAFRPAGHYAAPAPVPPTQGTLYPGPADSRAPHQKPRQTSLADLEQKVPTNYEVIGSPAVAMSSAPTETGYGGPAVSSSYEQGKAPEPPRAGDRSGSASLSSAPTYPSDSHYTSLEQNVPRNYVMIDDISELTKDSTSTAPDSQRLEPMGPSSSGRPGKDPGEPGVLEGPALPCCYARGEEESEEDSYDPRGKSGPHRGVESNGRPPSTHYYGDSDYRHGARAEKYGPAPVGPKHPSKSLAPAAVSSKRSKHRKQGMEQKISKFSPIEEAKDVESDLASYPSPAVSSNLPSRGRKFQDEITYGLKKNVYEQQRYYGVSGRDPIEEDDRMYGGSSRSRVASAYSGEKLSSHDYSGRGKVYEREREAVERHQKGGPKPSSLSMAHGRARPPMRSQASEEESPVSPLGRPRPAGGAIPPGDTCPQFCSSHSMPDVQEHVKDGPRAHAYKREEGYILDDSHCVVSDSEAYHLGQEETDWFDKPRDARSDRFRHHGGHAVSSSQKRGPARHSYHDYDEPPEEGMWPHDEGGPSRHTSAKEHRHHGDHGRHSGRHAGEEPGRRAAKAHARELGRHEARPHPQPSSAPAMQKKGQPGYPSSAEYSQPSRVPSAYHHASDSKKGSRQAHSGSAALQPKPEPQPQGRQAAPGAQQSQPPPPRQTPSAAAARQPQMQQPPQPPPQQQQPQQQQQGLGLQPAQQAPPQARLQQQGQPTARGPAPAAGQPAGKPQPGPATAAGPPPAGPARTEQANGSKGIAKAPQQGRPPQAQAPPGSGPTGTKTGARPGGAPAAPAGQPGAEGESVFSKILPGGAAEQAGKLTEAVSAFGKKFSSFW